MLFVNDSKATNADAAAKALACFDDIYWIAGGKAEGRRHRRLADFFPRIRKAYLIGEAAEEFAATLDGKVAVRDRRHARPRGRAGGARRRGVGARGAGGAAVAGLRVVRPVPEFRGARRRLPRAGAGAAGRRARCGSIAFVNQPGNHDGSGLAAGDWGAAWSRARNARRSATGGGPSTG